MDTMYDFAMTPLGLVASIVGAVLSSQVLATVIASWFAKQKVSSEALKDRAEADATTTRVTLELVSVLNTRITNLENALEQLRKENLELRLENVKLREQLDDLTQKVDHDSTSSPV